VNFDSGWIGATTGTVGSPGVIDPDPDGFVGGIGAGTEGSGAGTGFIGGIGRGFSIVPPSGFTGGFASDDFGVSPAFGIGAGSGCACPGIGTGCAEPSGGGTGGT
jgi:hypothetical protein